MDNSPTMENDMLSCHLTEEGLREGNYSDFISDDEDMFSQNIQRVPDNDWSMSDDCLSVDDDVQSKSSRRSVRDDSQMSVIVHVDDAALDDLDSDITKTTRIRSKVSLPSQKVTSADVGQDFSVTYAAGSQPVKSKANAGVEQKETKDRSLKQDENKSAALDLKSEKKHRDEKVDELKHKRFVDISHFCMDAVGMSTYLNQRKMADHKNRYLAVGICQMIDPETIRCDLSESPFHPCSSTDKSHPVLDLKIFVSVVGFMCPT